MCLDRVTKLDFDPEKEVTAYKIFFKNKNGALFSPNFRNSNIESNKWVNEKDHRKYTEAEYIVSYNDEDYLIGFHAYKKLGDTYLILRNILYVSPYIIKKVKLRKIVAEGIQDGLKVIVAKEMFITDEKI